MSAQGAVISGDRTCVRSLIHASRSGLSATGPSQRRSGANIRLEGTNQRLMVVSVRDPMPTPWPGGVLVWLLPERGPSEQDLAELTGALLALPPEVVTRIVLCVPASVTEPQAAEDVQIVGRNLDWVIPEGMTVSVEALWLWGGGPVRLQEWLRGV